MDFCHITFEVAALRAFFVNKISAIHYGEIPTVISDARVAVSSLGKVTLLKKLVRFSAKKNVCFSLRKEKKSLNYLKNN